MTLVWQWVLQTSPAWRSASVLQAVSWSVATHGLVLGAVRDADAAAGAQALSSLRNLKIFVFPHNPWLTFWVCSCVLLCLASTMCSCDCSLTQNAATDVVEMPKNAVVGWEK